MSEYWTITPEWTGRTAFIVGGGPSLCSIDLTVLRDQKVIAINSSFRAVPFADFLIFSDARWYEEHRAQLVDWPGRIVCLSRSPNDPRLLKVKRKIPPGFDQPNDTLSVQFTTATGAIDLAVKLGAAKIVLLGIDGQNAADGKTHHHKPHLWPPVAGGFEKQRRDLASMVKPLRDRGVDCVLGSPSAYSDLWPQADLTMLLPTKPTPIERPKPPIVLTTFWGLGDNLHVRAIVRELVKRYSVHLHTCHVELYHDLIEQHGVKVHLRPTRLRAQAKTIEREAAGYCRDPLPAGARHLQTQYGLAGVKDAGSILQAMIRSVGLSIERPDFSLPVKPAWRELLDRRLAVHAIDKPIMVLRPATVRKEYPPTARRNPHAGDFAALYAAIRDRFFVISVADLERDQEWIDGPELPADLKFHAGQFDFGDLAALWSRAALFFGPAGFGPILAQAVGTPSITVFGGNECFATTQAAGAHLAPSLGIDPIKPCDCHGGYRGCNRMCDKRIDVSAAIEHMNFFIESHKAFKRALSPRVLIFGTVFEDNAARAHLTDLWVKLHGQLNPDCDLMLIDSQSPHRPGIAERHSSIGYFNFSDNVGHLSRKGADGWGRAFCKGLELAAAFSYDYAVHIEGDSLLRLPVRPIVEQMARDQTKALSTPVAGMRIPGSETGWTETGLMFFDCRFLQASRLVERYAWPRRRSSPTPEKVVCELLGDDLKLMPWRAWRGDKQQITAGNVVGLGLDWLTHVHHDVEAYDRFADDVLASLDNRRGGPDHVPDHIRGRGPLRINLGCGTNKLDGWQNHDSDVDIAKPLPFESDSVSFILIEHCVEHVDYRQAIDFFREAFRVLQSGGVLRVIVPSIEQIRERATPEYCRFTGKWQNVGPTVTGALDAIIYAHGHKAIWTASLLETVLFFVGFPAVIERLPGQSDHAELRGIDGHARVIGAKFNAIESCIFEATKD